MLAILALSAMEPGLMEPAVALPPSPWGCDGGGGGGCIGGGRIRWELTAVLLPCCWWFGCCSNIKLKEQRNQIYVVYSGEGYKQKCRKNIYLLNFAFWTEKLYEKEPNWRRLQFFYLLLPVGWINICWDGSINHGSSWSFLFCKGRWFNFLGGNTSGENHIKQLERECCWTEHRREKGKERKQKKERREGRGGFGRRGNEKQK